MCECGGLGGVRSWSSLYTLLVRTCVGASTQPKLRLSVCLSVVLSELLSRATPPALVRKLEGVGKKTNKLKTCARRPLRVRGHSGGRALRCGRACGSDDGGGGRRVEGGREGGEVERHRERASERASRVPPLCLAFGSWTERKKECCLFLSLILRELLGFFCSYSSFVCFFFRFEVWKSPRRRATVELIKAAPI